jgi:hypothetical protein
MNITHFFMLLAGFEIGLALQMYLEHRYAEVAMLLVSVSFSVSVSYVTARYIKALAELQK